MYLCAGALQRSASQTEMYVSWHKAMDLIESTQMTQWHNCDPVYNQSIDHSTSVSQTLRVISRPAQHTKTIRYLQVGTFENTRSLSTSSVLRFTAVARSSRCPTRPTILHIHIH